MTVLAYCDVPGCEDPKDPGFPRPAFRNGKCSSHMKQLQRTGTTTAIAEKLNPEERAIQSGTLMLEADSDADYNKHRRAFLAAARSLGDRERVETLKKSMKAAAARGKRIGRPPKVDTERVLQLVRLLGKASLVASVLGVTRMTVYRHLNGASNKRQGFVTASPGPRLTG
jgi:hypothetical protein